MEGLIHELFYRVFDSFYYKGLEFKGTGYNVYGCPEKGGCLDLLDEDEWE